MAERGVIRRVPLLTPAEPSSDVQNCFCSLVEPSYWVQIHLATEFVFEEYLILNTS